MQVDSRTRGPRSHGNSAHRLLVIQDGVAVLDQGHQVLSLVVSVGLLLEPVDVLGRGGGDRYGVMAYERHLLEYLYCLISDHPTLNL